MKKYQSVFGLLLLALVAISVSCSKYDEGPFISLRSPESRIEGLWTIEQVFINEMDVTTQYYADTIIKRFSVSQRDDELFISIVEMDRSNPQWSYSLLVFSKNKKNVTFEFPVIAAYRDYTDDLFELIPALTSENQWNILRLTKDEWWIRCEFNGVTYKIIFKLVEDYRLN